MTLRSLTKEITGCDLVVTQNPYGHYQHPGFIEVPQGRGRKEAIVHEVCHWVVASDEERQAENLGMPAIPEEGSLVLPQSQREIRERQTCQLERVLYSASGKDIPKNPSCAPRLKRKLNSSQLQWTMDRAKEVGWDKLLALVAAKR